MKLVPYLNFAGNAEEALNFYAEALGGNIAMVSRYGDTPMPCDEDYKQKIIHARLELGDNMLMLSDGMKDKPFSTDGNIQLSVDIPDLEQLEQVFGKMSDGGEVLMALQDTFWGARFGMLKDKFGVGWMFNHELKK